MADNSLYPVMPPKFRSPKGFDPALDRTNANLERARKIAEQSRRGLEEENKQRESEGTAPLNIPSRSMYFPAMPPPQTGGQRQPVTDETAVSQPPVTDETAVSQPAPERPPPIKRDSVLMPVKRPESLQGEQEAVSGSIRTSAVPFLPEIYSQEEDKSSFNYLLGRPLGMTFRLIENLNDAELDKLYKNVGKQQLRAPGGRKEGIQIDLAKPGSAGYGPSELIPEEKERATDKIKQRWYRQFVLKNLAEEEYVKSLPTKDRKEFRYKQMAEAQRKFADIPRKMADGTITLEDRAAASGSDFLFQINDALSDPESSFRIDKDGKSISQEQAILNYMDETGVPEDDFVRQLLIKHGNRWLGVPKVSLLNTAADVFYAQNYLLGMVSATGTGLGVAAEVFVDKLYQSGVAKVINELLPGRRKPFSGKLKEDVDNMSKALWGIWQTSEEAFIPLAGPMAAVGAVKQMLRKNFGGGKQGRFAKRQLKEWDDVRKGRMIRYFATEQTATARAAKKKAADDIAKANSDIEQLLLKDFHETHPAGKEVVNIVDGKYIVDRKKLREAGGEVTDKLFVTERGIQETVTGMGGTKRAGETFELPDTSRDVLGRVDPKGKPIEVGLEGIATGKDFLTSPILNPDGFNPLIAVVADLKKANPKLLELKKGERLIDKLFDITVNKELLPDEDLFKLLNKYNVTYEDYMLSVVHSGSTAGKVLNKLRQLRRLRPKSEMDELARASQEETQGAIRNWIMRVENIRRGLLVSQIATAARNLSSAVIRMPAESLGNVMDTALYNMAAMEGHAGKKLFAGVKASISPANWSGSMRGFQLMFKNPRMVKEYTDLILKHPSMDQQFKLLMNNLNEIQALTGRGKGGAADAVASRVEDAVMFLNIPNRAQEFLVRRSMFMGEMERLAKRHMGVDLIKVMNEGKLDELMNFVPKGKNQRTFADIAADSVQRALDVTYAKQPDVSAFKTMSTFITRNGLTVAMPFPRFMFNGIELITQYASGASLPLTKYMGHLIKKSIKRGARPDLPAFGEKGFVLTAKDRQRISRNFVGLAAITGAYAYRTSDDAPEDFAKMAADDGKVINVKPAFPLAQVFFLGEAVKQLFDPLKGPEDKRNFAQRLDIDNFVDWFSHGNIPKRFAETFLGTNIRTGVGQGIVEELLELGGGMFSGETDLVKSERAAKVYGRLLGNYISTWGVPIAQIVDVQRAMNFRTKEKKDARKDPVLGDPGQTLWDELGRPWKSRIPTPIWEPGKEEELPARGSLTTDDPSRQRIAAKVSLGLNFENRDSKEAEFLEQLGWQTWQLGSKSRYPSIQKIENEQLKRVLPSIVDEVKEYETLLRDNYDSRSAAWKEKNNWRLFRRRSLRFVVDKRVAKHKAWIRKIAVAGYKGDDENIIPETVKQQITWRRTPANLRTKALEVFVQENNDRRPNYADVKDIASLVELAKRFRSLGSKK